MMPNVSIPTNTVPVPRVSSDIPVQPPAPISTKDVPPQYHAAPQPINPKEIQNKPTSLLRYLFILAGIAILLIFFSAPRKNVSDRFVLIPDAPTLTALPAYSSVSTITVTGQTTKSNESVRLFLNGKELGRTISDNQNVFKTQMTVDKEQSYFIVAKVTHYILWIIPFTSPESNTITFTYDHTPPTLTLGDIPKTVSKAQLTITGNASEPSQILISVNNQTITTQTDATKNFSLPVTFTEGQNQLKVYGQDLAGNKSTESSYAVNYTIPMITPLAAKTKRLPNSAGSLSQLSQVMTPYLLTFFALMAAVTYGASFSFSWLLKQYRR